MTRKVRKPPVVNRPVERVETPEPERILKNKPKVKPSAKPMSDAITRAWNERGLI